MTPGRPRTGQPRRGDDLRAAIAYCLTPAHLRRTVLIGLVVGTILTLVNQSDVILAGEAGPTTALKVAANYVIPFIVSNLGLLSGRDETDTPRSA